MPSWLHSLTSKLTGILGSKAPSAHIGVFGKHPGWNDHIDDLGLDSEALVAAKQYLYVNGIGGVIDSGKWENVASDDVLIPYRHVFVWRDQSNSIFGRMWDSSDGKGRTKYPMAVCVHLSGRTTPGLPNALPLLEELETGCKSVSTAEDVLTVIAGARLRASGLLESPSYIPASRESVASQIGIQPDSESAARIAYASGNYLASMRSVPSSEINLKFSTAKYQPQHLRVPSDPKEPMASIVFWQDFFKGFLAQSVPQFYLASLDAPWLDIIAGPLTSKHLVCIRSGGKSMPVANDIPFDIPPADREAARSRWAGFLAST